jgi:hypothetical protein
MRRAVAAWRAATLLQCGEVAKAQQVVSEAVAAEKADAASDATTATKASAPTQPAETDLAELRKDAELAKLIEEWKGS